MEDINLMDIAEELLIVNKITIDKLFQLDNAADCIALYMLYYKTAKWQKTNQPKATDEYVRKCLKWGLAKIRKTKHVPIKSFFESMPTENSEEKEKEDQENDPRTTINVKTNQMALGNFEDILL